MITVRESGLEFGPFHEKDLFRVEKSPYVSRLQGIKACEFAWWREQESQLILIEAKSSVPNPQKSRDNYDKFFSDIFEKFDNSMQLLAVGNLKRTAALASELGDGISQVDWSKASIRLFLVIPQVPKEYLPPITDKLRKILCRQHKIWRADISVINENMARKHGLLAAKDLDHQ